MFGRRSKKLPTEIRRVSDGKLRGMTLLQRGSRLSVMPVDDAHWRFILSLE